MFLHNLPTGRTATVETETFCDLLVFERKVFDQILARHPGAQQMFDMSIRLIKRKREAEQEKATRGIDDVQGNGNANHRASLLPLPLVPAQSKAPGPTESERIATVLRTRLADSNGVVGTAAEHAPLRVSSIQGESAVNGSATLPAGSSLRAGSSPLAEGLEEDEDEVKSDSSAKRDVELHSSKAQSSADALLLAGPEQDRSSPAPTAADSGKQTDAQTQGTDEAKGGASEAESSASAANSPDLHVDVAFRPIPKSAAMAMKMPASIGNSQRQLLMLKPIEHARPPAPAPARCGKARPTILTL